MNKDSQAFDDFLRANQGALNVLPNELFQVGDISLQEDMISRSYLKIFNISLDSNEPVLITLTARELYHLLINLQRDIKSQINK